RRKVGSVTPRDLPRRLRGRGGVAVQVSGDASDSQVAGSAMNVATALGPSRSIELLRQTAGGARLDRVQGLDVRVRAWYNPDQESALFIVPGLIGALLMQTTITIMAVAGGRERPRRPPDAPG